jgi:uncharacterized repeat protein (TIGR03987 family)
MMDASNVPMIVISLALVFYSIGVWSERIMGELKRWHLIFFVLGLICDTWGTGMMSWINRAIGNFADVYSCSLGFCSFGETG